MSNEKLKADIFDGHQISQLINSKHFCDSTNKMELVTCCVVLICRAF